MFEFSVYLYAVLFFSYFLNKPKQFMQKISGTNCNWDIPYKTAEFVFFPMVFPFVATFYLIKYLISRAYQKTQNLFHTNYRPLVLDGLEKELARQYDEARIGIKKRTIKSRDPKAKVVKGDPGKRKGKTT